MEDHHYGQKENLTGPDIFDKPIDLSLIHI